MSTMTFVLVVLAIGFSLGIAGLIVISASAHKHYDEMDEVPRRYRKCEILLISNMREAEVYNKAYPDLLNDIYKICLVGRPQDHEGLRVTRVYMTQTVDLYDAGLWILKQSLCRMPPSEADPMPIQLRLDDR